MKWKLFIVSLKSISSYTFIKAGCYCLESYSLIPTRSPLRTRFILKDWSSLPCNTPFGRCEHPQSVNSSFGWFIKTECGRRAVFNGRDGLTLLCAPYTSARMRRRYTCSSNVRVWNSIHDWLGLTDLDPRRGITLARCRIGGTASPTPLYRAVKPYSPLSSSSLGSCGTRGMQEPSKTNPAYLPRWWMP